MKWSAEGVEYGSTLTILSKGDMFMIDERMQIVDSYSTLARTFGISVICMMVAACATTPPPAEPPQTVNMTCKLPTFAPLTETKELQEKGGLQISLAPAAYNCVQDKRVTVREVQTPMSRQTGGIVRTRPPSPTARYVERSETPFLKVAPERLAFTVKINNKLPRVFRGAGIVVQFNVAGKLQAVDQTGYADLTNIIVPPRTEAQVEIFGPGITSLPDKTTIALFLYDVVTKTDAAGNIVEKQNFEWFYNYAIQHKEQVGTVRKSEGWTR